MSLDKAEYATLLDIFEGMTYPQLAGEMVERKKLISRLDGELKLEKEKFDVLRLKVIPDKMDDEGMSSLNIRGLGRLGLSLDVHAGILAKDRELWYEWLNLNGHEALVKLNVNAQTQKAFIKEQLEAGNPLPDFVKAEPFYRASVTKA